MVLKKVPFLFVPIFLVVGIAAFLLWQIDQYTSLTDWVDRTDQVIATINLIEKQVIDLETGVRGFVITGDPDFLEPYYRSRAELSSTTKDFRNLVRDNPAQEERMDQVEAIESRWLDFAKTVTDLKKSNADTSSLVRNRTGKVLVDSMRSRLEEMRSVEEQLKVKRISAARSESRRIVWILLTSLLILVFVLLRSLRLRRRSEDALTASESRFRTMAEAVPQIVWMCDSNGMNTYFNQKWVDYTGMTLEESYGPGWNRPFHPDDQKRAWEAWDNAVKTDGIYALECRLRRADGVYRWWLIRGESLHDKNGKVVSWFGTCTDIEDLKRAEAELAASEQKHRALFEGAYDSILVADSNGNITSVNPQAEKLFGYKAQELIGQPIEVLMPERFRHGHVEKRHLYYKSPTGRAMGVGLELFGKTKEGTEIPIDISLSPTKSHGETFVTIIGRDISQVTKLANERKDLLELEKKAREEADRARAEAQQANDAKDAFLATLSHELRTPLTSTLLRAQVLKRIHALPENVALGISQIEKNARIQEQMINDLLDIARIQVGKLALKLDEIEPLSIVREAVEATRPLADANKISIRLFGTPNIGFVMGDHARLRQVVSNLLSNSIKFSPNGSQIEIHVAMSSRGDRGFVEIKVVDHGKGIEPSFIPHIFGRFQQQDDSSVRVHGGLGIGLALVRDLVRAHGGSVKAESPGVGQGATFTVLLPTISEVSREAMSNRKATRPGEEAGPPNLSGLKVLIVEDDPASLELFAEIVELFGGEPITCNNAKDALVAFDKDRPHIIVSDIGMPHEDGYSFIKKIRALPPEKGGRVPAIALTAFAALQDKAKAADAGFQEHLSKPIDTETLGFAIRRLAMAEAV